jgi:hypothetical protein
VHFVQVRFETIDFTGFSVYPISSKIQFLPLYFEVFLENVFLNYVLSFQDQPFVDSFRMIS